VQIQGTVIRAFRNAETIYSVLDKINQKSKEKKPNESNIKSKIIFMYHSLLNTVCTKTKKTIF